MCSVCRIMVLNISKACPMKLSNHTGINLVVSQTFRPLFSEESDASMTLGMILKNYLKNYINKPDRIHLMPQQDSASIKHVNQ